MTDRYKSYKWRDKNKFKWMRRMAILLPDTKKDVDAVLEQRKRCLLLTIFLALPLAVLWFPFGLICRLLSLLEDGLLAVHNFLFKLSAPKRRAFDKLHKLSLAAEHGDYKTRAHRLKTEHEWDYPSYHYVNNRRNGGT